MKISEETKKIVSCYNVSEEEKRKMEKEIQEYVDKRIEGIMGEHHRKWVEEMKKIAQNEWEEWMKLIEKKNV
jgi:hypothetical protein